MLAREEIIDKLKDILVSADENNASKVDGFTEQSNLAVDMGLNSIGMLYMVISIEETFGIRFEDVSISDFVTLGDVVNYICSRL